MILERSAVAELLQYLLWMFDARRADEGRSFMSRKGGGTKLGENLFDTKVTIYSDPQDTTVPATSYSYDGVPHGRAVWVEDGVVRNLHCSRFWAQQMGRDPLPIPESLVMAGGTSSVDEMIRSTRRGILVTRLWYMNFIDPQTLLLTGLTRDGNFLIENGRIVGPARNLRFNESLVTILSNVVAVGPSERSYGGDSRNSAISVPPLLVDGFTFSSRSSGI
jgi:predicted Zn-dependent protease